MGHHVDDNNNENLVHAIDHFYDNAIITAVHGSTGEWIRTVVGVRQRCLFSPTHLNLFLERIMLDALKEHSGKFSVGGITITNLLFADAIDALAEEEQELYALVESFNETCTRYKMER